MYRDSVCYCLDETRRPSCDQDTKTAVINNQETKEVQWIDILSDPAPAFLFFPYPLEFLDKLHSELLLTKIASSFDNDGYTVPVG
jgi:hypothetical protein